MTTETDVAALVNFHNADLTAALVTYVDGRVAAATPPPATPAPPVTVTLDAAEQTAFLNAIGLGKLTPHRAWQIFQAAYNLGPALSIDGICGPLTSAAATNCMTRGGNLSEHFHWSEMLCRCQRKGGAHYNDCDGWKVTRRLLQGLEEIRASYYPAGLPLVGVYRCRRANIDAGSKAGESSRHRYGDAADIPARIAWTNIPATMAPTLTWMGYNKNGLVIHVQHKPGQARSFGPD